MDMGQCGDLKLSHESFFSVCFSFPTFWLGITSCWPLSWCHSWRFCGGRPIHDCDVESFIFNRRPGQEFIGRGFNKFFGDEDMVEKRFVHINANKQTNETNDGFNRFVCVDVEDCSIEELSSEIVDENN